MSLLAALPAPQKHHAAPIAATPTSTSMVLASAKEAPPYLRRKGFVPRRPEDFGGGGAFPEIHMAQFPLDMGRDAQGQGNKQLAVALGSDGQLNYDAIVKQGGNRNRVVHSDHLALAPKVDRLGAEALARPSEEDIEKTKAETMAAIEKLVTGKLSSVNPSTLPDQPGTAKLIQYIPAQKGPQHASGAEKRIIKMQDMPVDPLEPPKFRHVKAPRGPGSPPVPVLHSPPRQLTVKDQADWKIPPCISNWKNPKGYTIPLDKRLAADGRGLQQSQINDKFASLSEALFTAESKAREAITMRTQIQKELAAKEKSRKEAELRALAMQARMERTGGIGARVDDGLPPPPPRPAVAARDFHDLPPPPPRGPGHEQHFEHDGDFDRPGRGGGGSREGRGGGGGRHGEEDELLEEGSRASGYGRGGRGGGGGEDDGYRESREEREERRRREDIMEERKRERERERRLEAAGTLTKKSKITRDRERDISEKVALGMANVNQGGEVAYDQRLFNQDAGMASGFGADDQYNTYDKPLFAERQGNQLKPTRRADDEEDGDAGAGGDGERGRNFRPDRGFQGADGGASARGGALRLEFERQPAARQEEPEADPFGLDQFLSEVKGGKKKALDGLGQGGSMRAAAGGASFGDGESLSGRRMQFTAETRR